MYACRYVHRVRVSCIRWKPGDSEFRRVFKCIHSRRKEFQGILDPSFTVAFCRYVEVYFALVFMRTGKVVTQSEEFAFNMNHKVVLEKEKEKEKEKERERERERERKTDRRKKERRKKLRKKKS